MQINRFCNSCRQFLIPGRAAPKAHEKCSKDYNAVSYYCSVCRQMLQDGGPENKAHIKHLHEEAQRREHNQKIELARIEQDTPKIHDKGRYIPVPNIPGVVAEEALVRKMTQRKQKT